MLAAAVAAMVSMVGGAGYWLLQAPAPAANQLVEHGAAAFGDGAGKRLAGPDFARPATPAIVPAQTAGMAPGQAPQPWSKPAPAPRDEQFVIKSILPIDGPIRYGEWHWDESEAPATGPLVMTVDLEARVLSVFRAGHEIGATAVLLGTQDKPTPLGRFPIIWKKADHYSSTYNGAPMPFTQRLTRDGVSIHGTRVEKGYASHGCIGVPNGFGKKLFAITKLGDVVYITRGKRVGKGDSLIGG